MATPKSRLTRLWILLGACLAAIPLAVVMVDPVGRHWAEMVARVAAIEEELDSVSHERQPLGGPPTAGRACDAYDEAYALMRAHGNGKHLGIGAWDAAEAGALIRRKETARLAAAMSRELEAIQRGARCLDAAPRVDWSMGLAHRIPKLMDTRPLSDVLVLQGLAEIEDGGVEEGCAKILDAMQFAQDLTRSPILICQMIGVSQAPPRALVAFLETEGMSALSPDALATLEEGLARLLATPRESPTLHGELVFLGRELINHRGNLGQMFGTGLFDGGPAFAIAPRWACADGVLVLADAYDELAGLTGNLFAERARELEAELQGSSNPLLQVFSNTASCEASYRHSIVRLGQLRYALRAALELPPLPFLDPHGEKLTVSDDGTTLHLSVARGRYPIELHIRH